MRFPFIAACFAVAAFMFILSLPGIPEQIRELAAFIGMSGYEWHWWNYVGVSFGLILMLFSLYPLWLQAARFFGGDAVVNWTAVRARVIEASLMLCIFTALGIGIGAYIIFAPTYVWFHPKIPWPEQAKIAAQCEKESIKASTAAFGRDRGREIAHYYGACLVEKGFVRIDASKIRNGQ